MGIEQASLSLEQALGLLRRRAPWILLCFVLAIVAAYGFSKHQTKQYTATSSLVFSTNQLSQEVAGLQAIGSGATPQALQNTNVKLVQLGDMAARTAALLGQGLSKEKVDAALSSRHSRVKQSRTPRMRVWRPFSSRSWQKSRHQASFGPVSSGPSDLGTTSLRRLRWRMPSPSALQMR